MGINEEQNIRKIFSLALKDHENKKFESAEKLYKSILKIKYDHFETVFLLGTLYAQVENFTEAKKLLQNCIKLNPKHIDSYNNLSIVLIKLQDFEEGKKILSKLLILKHNHLEGNINLGNIFFALNKYDDAIKYFNKAIEIQPNFPLSYNNLGNVLKRMGNFSKAVSFYQKAIQKKSDYVDAHTNLMQIYEKTNRDEELKKTIIEAKKMIKNNPIINLYEGIVLYRDEKFNEAIKFLELISFDKKDINKETLRISTLAKCYDAIGNYNKAFTFFISANKLFSIKGNAVKFNKNKFLNEIKIRIDFFKKPFLNKWIEQESIKTNSDPIFLVGFPRSGTTLLDVILDSHPLIQVVEEQDIVKRMLDSISSLTGNNFNKLKDINSNQIKEIRNIYFQTLESKIIKKADSKFYIDKLPFNMIYIGEILRIFPNSKFIFSLRHPCDSVLSCFIQDFNLNDAMVNFLDLRDSAYLYNISMKLWEQYKFIFKFDHYEIKYESLVENLDDTIMSILNFLGIPWNDCVLEYHKTAKKRERVNTPSYNQVTKPIYTKSIGRWKNYEKEISKIYPFLENWIKKFDY